MFSVNLKLSNRKIAVILLTFILATVVVVSLRLESFNKQTVEGITCSTEADVKEYLDSFGLQTGDCTVDEITVPFEFNDVYHNYNEIQLSQGFDLSEYKGKVLNKYTFNVLNHPDGEHIFAEVLIFEGTVVGADVYSTELDGFISPLK